MAGDGLNGIVNSGAHHVKQPDKSASPPSWPDYRAVWRWHFYAGLFCIPFVVVLIMAALSTINDETLEAAELDGARGVQRFAYVIFPQIKAMVVVLLVYNALTAFTSYDIVYAMTGGGPGTATTLLAFQIWRESFSMYDFGAGSAVAFIVVAISAMLIIAITRAMPSDLFEEEA